MNADLLTPIDSELERISAMSLPEVRAALDYYLGLSARGLVLAARCFRIMDEAGDDVSGYPIGRYLRRIESGHLIPELFEAFRAKPRLIDVIGRLSVHEQRRLIKPEEGVPLAVVKADGSVEEMLKRPGVLTAAQIKQVFDGDEIRNFSQQQALISEKRFEASKPVPSKIGKDAELDMDGGGLRITRRTFLTLADLKTAVRLLEK